MAVEPNFRPGRWWRVIAPDGSLWCETSWETEARESLRPGDELQRLWVRTDHEWRPVTASAGGMESST